MVNPNIATPAKGKKRSSKDLEITALVANIVQTVVNRNTYNIDMTVQFENLNFPFSMVLLLLHSNEPTKIGFQEFLKYGISR